MRGKCDYILCYARETLNFLHVLQTAPLTKRDFKIFKTDFVVLVVLSAQFFA